MMLANKSKSHDRSDDNIGDDYDENNNGHTKQ